MWLHAAPDIARLEEFCSTDAGQLAASTLAKAGGIDDMQALFHDFMPSLLQHVHGNGPSTPFYLNCHGESAYAHACR